MNKACVGYTGPVIVAFSLFRCLESLVTIEWIIRRMPASFIEFAQHLDIKFHSILCCSTLKHIPPTMKSTVSTELVLFEQQRNAM